MTIQTQNLSTVWPFKIKKSFDALFLALSWETISKIVSPSNNLKAVSSLSVRTLTSESCFHFKPNVRD